MYVHPTMVEILEEERRRESYADARQLRMFERELLRLERGPGLLERGLGWLWARLVAAGQRMRAKFSAPVTRRLLQSERRSLRSECETC